MNIFEAIVLGAVQGLTEFLPVSSSGHLAIFQHFFGLMITTFSLMLCSMSEHLQLFVLYIGGYF